MQLPKSIKVGNHDFKKTTTPPYWQALCTRPY